MDITSAKAQHGVFTTANPTSLGSSGRVEIGETISDNVVDPTSGWRVEITSTGAGDVVTLNLTTGAATQDVGTANVSRFPGQIDNLAGLDFEGQAIVQTELADIHMIADAANTGNIEIVASANTIPDVFLTARQYVQAGRHGGQIGITFPGTLQITLTQAGDKVTIDCIGATWTP